MTFADILEAVPFYLSQLVGIVSLAVVKTEAKLIMKRSGTLKSKLAL